MVQPATDSDDSNDFDQDEEYQRDSFGLVSLVDLEPGLVLYVAGVDDGTLRDYRNDIGDEDQNRDEGILKVILPENGISMGSYFGYGKHLYLGDQWEPVLEELNNGEANDEGGGDDVKLEEFRFSVHQLYLYCVEKEYLAANEDAESTTTSIVEEYKILAALSTTGRSFASDGSRLPLFWENYEHQHSNVKLSDEAKDLIGSSPSSSSSSNSVGGSGSKKYYGVIVLPEDASKYGSSGGYQYNGPSYEENNDDHDQYAKALTNEANWKRMNDNDNKDDNEAEFNNSNTTNENHSGSTISSQESLDGTTATTPSHMKSSSTNSTLSSSNSTNIFNDDRDTDDEQKQQQVQTQKQQNQGDVAATKNKTTKTTDDALRGTTIHSSGAYSSTTHIVLLHYLITSVITVAIATSTFCHHLL